MNKEKFQQIVEKIDRLASSSVLLDTNSPQEVNDFIVHLRDIQKQSSQEQFETVEGIIGLFANALEYVLPNNTVKVNDVIGYSINVLQDYSRQALSDSQVILDLESIKQNLDVVTGAVADTNQMKFTAVQLKELPEFISNTQGRIEEIEKDILEIEKSTSVESLNSALRGFHTIKGEAGILGLTNITELTHEVESILQKGKAGDVELDIDVIDLILSITDVYKDVLQILEKDVPRALSFDITDIKKQINSLIEQKSVINKPVQQEVKVEVEIPIQKETDYICKIPDINIDENKELVCEFLNESFDHLSTAENSLLILENTPDSAEEINKTFRAFHTIKGVASFINLDDIKNLTHETETMMDMVRKGTLHMDSVIADTVFMAIDGTRKLLILLKEQVENQGQLKSEYYDVSAVIKNVRARIKGTSVSKPEAPPVKIGELLVEKGVILEQELEQALEIQQQEHTTKKIGEILVDMKSVTPTQVDRSLQEQQQQQSTLMEQTVKIGINKLDNLIDMVGELVITGTQVSQNPFIKNIVNPALTKDLSQLSRIIRDTQDVSLSMRLVQIKPVFQKMQRLVRDVSKKANKSVDMTMLGEETEIDKNIIDLISDPIMHMVRNSVDHGIEPTEVRVKNGKSPVGKVELNAYHKGGNIVIEIKDDGAGLNKEKILKKAVEKGIVKENEILSENRIFNMIFEPGFSTADKITDISGRGVGMDVVKRNVEQLRGKIDIVSEMGKGTTFIIKSPLTLAIIDGIILMVGEERYIIPIYSIVEFFSPKQQDVTFVNGSPCMIMVHGSLFPLVFLSEHFKVKPEYTNIEQATVCVVESDFGRVCFVVDKILGQQQIVIKTLGESFKNIKGLSGGTILGDGRVGLILDVNGITEEARR